MADYQLSSTPLPKRTQNQSIQYLNSRIKDLKHELKTQKIKKLKFECEIRNKTVNEIIENGYLGKVSDFQYQERSNLVNMTHDSIKNIIFSIQNDNHPRIVPHQTKNGQAPPDDELSKCISERDELRRLLDLRDFELFELRMASASAENVCPSSLDMKYAKSIISKMEGIRSLNSDNRLVIADLSAQIKVLGNIFNGYVSTCENTSKQGTDSHRLTTDAKPHLSDSKMNVIQCSLYDTPSLMDVQASQRDCQPSLMDVQMSKEDCQPSKNDFQMNQRDSQINSLMSHIDVQRSKEDTHPLVMDTHLSQRSPSSTNITSHCQPSLMDTQMSQQNDLCQIPNDTSCVKLSFLAPHTCHSSIDGHRNTTSITDTDKSTPNPMRVSDHQTIENNSLITPLTRFKMTCFPVNELSPVYNSPIKRKESIKDNLLEARVSALTSSHEALLKSNSQLSLKIEAIQDEVEEIKQFKNKCMSVPHPWITSREEIAMDQSDTSIREPMQVDKEIVVDQSDTSIREPMQVDEFNDILKEARECAQSLKSTVTLDEPLNYSCFPVENDMDEYVVSYCEKSTSTVVPVDPPVSLPTPEPTVLEGNTIAERLKNRKRSCLKSRSKNLLSSIMSPLRKRPTRGEKEREKSESDQESFPRKRLRLRSNKHVDYLDVSPSVVAASKRTVTADVFKYTRSYH